MIMSLTVDDILDICTNELMRKTVIDQIIEKFKYIDDGECEWFLGMKITQDYDEITISQEDFIKTITYEYPSAYNTNVPGKPGMKEGLDLWKDQVGLLGFGSSFHTQIEAASRATEIEIIRDALAGENKASLSHPEVGINFIERLKQAKIIGTSKEREKAEPKAKEDHPP
jgi:hypothetical protein